MKVIRVTVLNNKTFEIETTMCVLTDQVALTQQYEKVDDKTIPEIDIEINGKMQKQEKQFIKGTPAFCVVSLKSGLQMRVIEREEDIHKALNWDAVGEK